MGVEIERKFLLRDSTWKSAVESTQYIRQGYIANQNGNSVRVRLVNNSIGWLTIKGPAIGIITPEYEFSIPVHSANEMLTKLCERIIIKTRHNVPFEGKMWEIDVFEGLNHGLIVAEIELTHINENITLPEWVDEEVSADHRYKNVNLILEPYSSWSL